MHIKTYAYLTAVSACTYMCISLCVRVCNSLCVLIFYTCMCILIMYVSVHMFKHVIGIFKNILYVCTQGLKQNIK